MWTELVSSVHAHYNFKTQVFVPKLVIPIQPLVQSLAHTSSNWETPEQGQFVLCYMIKYALHIVYELGLSV